MKKKFVGILLATTLIVSSDLGMNVENVYADNANNSGNSTAATVLQSENKDINQSQSVNSNPRIPFVTQDSLFVNENPVL